MCWCRYQVLLATSQLQRIAKRYEDAAAGKYKPQSDAQTGGGTPASDQLQHELTKAVEKHEKLVGVVQVLQEQAPMLHEELDRVLAHAQAASSWLQGQKTSSDGVLAH